MKSRAKEINIHASCVAIGRAGVLLLGASGSGKSDLALRLIDGGARLVADDRVLLSAKKGALHAGAPATIRGLIEIRGVGIIKLPAAGSVPVRLAVELGREVSRLPAPRFYDAGPPLTHKVPLIGLDPRHASAPAKIRAALAAFSQGLFRGNFNPK